MRPTTIFAAAAAGALVLLAARAQPPERTLDERVGALETELEMLAARVAGRGNVAPSPLGTPEAVFGGRVAQLERTVDRLSGDLQRIERRVDEAVREAATARREAMAAERLARDAAQLR
jgi:hypothetical protein